MAAILAIQGSVATAGPGLGGVSVQYRFATNACGAFNQISTLGSSGPLLGTPLAFNYTTDGCSDTTDVGRYAWISYTLDDSQTATFSDISSNHTSITRMELYYHPAPSGRLRGGATFSNGSLQSLDAPPTPGAD